MASGSFSREELLGGLPARRASTLLFAIEARTAHLVARSRQAMARYLTERSVQERERAFLQALAQGRDLPAAPSIQDLERYANQWASLVPPDPNVRAAITYRLGEKYLFTHKSSPALRRALSLDDAAVQQAYERFYHQPLANIYAPDISRGEKLRWAWSNFARRVENLPPFWMAFSLTLTETVGSSILALPIAVAGIGVVPGALLIVLLGIINIITIAAMTEAVARNSKIRYGFGFIGTVVADYFGASGSNVFAVALLLMNFVALLAYYVGVAVSLADATGMRSEIWAGLLFLVNLYFIRRESINATVASALVTGAVNIVLILALCALAFARVNPAYLAYQNIPFVDGKPFEPGILQLIFGIILIAYFGHTATGNAARVALEREASGRGLIAGSIAAMTLTLILYTTWVVAINGAVAPAVLFHESGTVLKPLADAVGPIVHVIGSVYVVLGMGMASVHYALGLFNQVGERLPAERTDNSSAARANKNRVRQVFLSKPGRFALGILPLTLVFLFIEWLLFTEQESFAEPLGFLGVIAASLLGGIFPMLLLVASRRKAEYVPALVVRFLGHPLLLVSIYTFFLGGLLLHGLAIWQDPFQRAVALVTAAVVIAMPIVFIRRGAFTPRVVVEMQMMPARRTGTFNIVADGMPLPADVRLQYDDGEQHLTAATGSIERWSALRSATVRLEPTNARELKLLLHQITDEREAQPLLARVTVRQGNQVTPLDLTRGREPIVALAGQPVQVEIIFASI